MAVAATTLNAGPVAMGLSADQAAAVRAICRKHSIGLCYLFGSRASGDSDSLSDWDLGIVFGRDNDRPTDTRRWLEITADLEDVFAPDAVDPVFLERATPFLRWEAMRGTIVYAENDTARADFEESVMRIWMDLKPFMEAQLREQSEAIGDGHFLG